MKLAAGAQLLSLVTDATLVSSAVHNLTRSNPHPIGAGIKAKKAYATDVGKFALPQAGTGMQRLKELGVRQIAGLTEEESRAVWCSLLQTPKLTLVVPIPSGDEWASNGKLVPRERLRQLTLVSVFRHDDEFLEAGVVYHAPFAGVATLTLALAETGGSSPDAWLTTTWHDSTRSLQGALEPVFGSIGMAHKASGTSVAIIFNTDEIDLADAGWEKRVKLSAAVAGVEANIFGLTSDQDTNFLEKTLSTHMPNHLLFVGTSCPLNDVRDNFGATHGFDRVGTLVGETPDDVLQSLRERFAAIVGLSPSLQIQLPRDTRPKRKAGSLPFPFQAEPTECLHLQDGHRYLRDPGTGLYWTRDTAGHSEIPFKTYRKTATQLLFEADRDFEGNRVTAKHKGAVLATIGLASLSPCSHPVAHKAS